MTSKANAVSRVFGHYLYKCFVSILENTMAGTCEARDVAGTVAIYPNMINEPI